LPGLAVGPAPPRNRPGISFSRPAVTHCPVQHSAAVLQDSPTALHVVVSAEQVCSGPQTPAQQSLSTLHASPTRRRRRPRPNQQSTEPRSDPPQNQRATLLSRFQSSPKSQVRTPLWSPTHPCQRSPPRPATATLSAGALATPAGDPPAPACHRSASRQTSPTPTWRPTVTPRAPPSPFPERWRRSPSSLGHDPVAKTQATAGRRSFRMVV